jgi:ABC-2 type transport system permease protein
MRNTWTVFRREMASYFVSPVAYVLLVAFLGLSAWFFCSLLTRFLLLMNRAVEQATMLQQMPPVVNINMGVMRPWFDITAELLLFLAPIITMRLLAEERGTGRLDLLLSAPITDRQLVLGKYLAGVGLCTVFLLPTAVFPLLLQIYGNPEPGQIVAGYVGLILLSAALVALGLAVSSMTGNQVVAAAASFGIILLMWVLGSMSGGEASGWGALLSYISMVEHSTDFANGVIEARHVVYYASFVLFMLVVAVRSIESQRWRG